ncbi:MAG: TolC family protein, partial [Myxococcales bacterium]
LTERVDDARRLTELQWLRSEKGEAAGLDAERSRLEEERHASTLAEERERLSEALIACAQLAGLPCEPFGSPDGARAFLASRAITNASLEQLTAELAERPDLKALQAREESARASEQLARAMKLPDPTLTAGYVHDRFVISGNQLNSFFVGMSLPLPVFDRGQADLAAARALGDAAARERALRLDFGARDLPRLVELLRSAERRRQRLRAEVLPVAERVVDRLASAVAAGGAPLQELLHARQTLSALLLDAAELDLTLLRLGTALQRTTGASREAAVPVARQDLAGALP